MVASFYTVCVFGIMFIVFQQFAPTLTSLMKSGEPFPDRMTRWSQKDIIVKLTPGETSSVYKELLKIVKEVGIPWVTVPVLNCMGLICSALGAVIYIAYRINAILTFYLHKNTLEELAARFNDATLAAGGTIDSSILTNCLMFAAIGYFIPIVCLKIVRFKRANLARQEAIMLKTYALMMLKTNRNVKYVVEVLYRRSNAFKVPLADLWMEFSKEPVTALEEAMEKTDSEDFKKILNTLYKSVLHDRTAAIEYLQRDREMSQEVTLIINKERNSKKNMFATILVVLPLVGALAVIAYPLLMEAMRMLNTAPI